MGSQLFPATQASGRLSVARDGTAAFSTIRAAIAAARAGDCVIVYPGTYKENNLLKDRVNLFFMPGAVVDYDATNDRFILYFSGAHLHFAQSEAVAGDCMGVGRWLRGES